ncbi:2-hydroxyacid dehydrogenase [Breoghania sp. L-A4]|uniref:2-hydroxyacid dehydrogenase n=1 Tax=Breoghania sp. L-A4 TaxID=2304600 RepID=UPI000E358003|nr:2-hydroxyacid dehydrogenase [Breoghania sp. L-A4]AXS41913.1 2-hydroxyacid dehydrogenase [Breoghania sp. L-A4]
MSRPEVLIAGPMLPYVVDGLESRFTVHKIWEHDDRDAFLADAGKRIRGVACSYTGVDMALINQLPKLEIISNFGVGYDAVDTKAAAARGIIVTHTPGVLDDEVADTGLALMLMCVRELPAAERYLRAGRWVKEGPYPLTRGSLKGRTLGILGLGRIGKQVAKRAEACGMSIVYHGRSEQADVPYRYFASLTEMAKACDVLISVAPGGAATHHIINAAVLSALGPGGYFVNIGRGSVVDEAALAEALDRRVIAGAGLDVYEFEPKVPAALMACDNAVLLPHVASASIPTRNAMGQLVIDNLVSWFDTGHPVTPVPETPFKA